MDASCLHFGQFSPPLDWSYTCGFIIDGIEYPVNQSPSYIRPGTVMTPFVGFYTGTELQGCEGSSNIRVTFKEVDTQQELSYIQLEVHPDTDYSSWGMPSIVMPSEDIHVKWQIHLIDPISGDLVLADETGTFYKRYIQCFEGETDCRSGEMWECNASGRWRNTYKPCETECNPGQIDCNGPEGTKRTCNASGHWVNTGETCSPTCTPGQTDCNGPDNTRRVCNASGQWINTGESCAEPQECDPLNEPYKCVDCGLFRCNNGYWEPVVDPPLLEHVKYCGLQCNLPLVVGIVGVAAVGIVGGYLYYEKNKNKKGKPKVEKKGR